MNRYLARIEAEAKETVQDNHRWDKLVVSGKEQDKNEIITRRKMEEENQRLLKEQMERNKGTRADRRREFIEAASSHSFPLFTETYISLDEVNEYHKQQKVAWRLELNEQKLVNDTLRAIQEKKLQDHVKKQQKQNIVTMTRERGQERERLVTQGREMVSSWERDIKLKTLKKAMAQGKDVVNEVARAVATINPNA